MATTNGADKQDTNVINLGILFSTDRKLGLHLVWGYGVETFRAEGLESQTTRVVILLGSTNSSTLLYLMTVRLQST